MWGRKEGRGGGQVLKGGCCSFLLTFAVLVSLIYSYLLLFISVVTPFLVPNLKSFNQITGGELRCLENTVAFLRVKHAPPYPHLATVAVRSPEHCPFFLLSVFN